MQSSGQFSEKLLAALESEAEYYALEAARADDELQVRRAQGAYNAMVSLSKKLKADANAAP